MTIIEQARKKYNEVITYHERTGYDTRLNFIWANNMPDIAKIFIESASAEELIDRIDQSFMYSINFPPENGENSGLWRSPGDRPHIREKQITWLLDRLEFDLKDLGFGESPYIHHRNKVVRDGITLSGNFLRTASIANRVKKHVGQVDNVLELGAGAGHQARTLLLSGVKKYTIVDLPETMLFSFCHLNLCFPDKNILYVSSEEDIAKIDDHDIVFVPAVFASFLHGRNYDLFMNTASMGEMRNDVIHYWMDFIQNKVNIKHLFTLNRYLNTVDEGHRPMRVNENECSVSYDKLWDIVNWELEPVYCRCPYIDTLHSRYVEIVAKRIQSYDNAEGDSEAWLQEAKDEDWYRLRDFYGGGVMQARMNVLVNDMTMSGTLFKLWQSIRLNPTHENVSIMIEYLNRITVSLPFEEMYYYEKLLEQLRPSDTV